MFLEMEKNVKTKPILKFQEVKEKHQLMTTRESLKEEMTRKHVEMKKKSMRKNVSSKKKSVWNSQKPQSYPLNKMRTLLKTKLMLNKKTTKELRNNQESNMAAKKLVLLVPQAPVELVLEFMVVPKAKEGIKLN